MMAANASALKQASPMRDLSKVGETVAHNKNARVMGVVQLLNTGESWQPVKAITPNTQQIRSGRQSSTPGNPTCPALSCLGTRYPYVLVLLTN